MNGSVTRSLVVFLVLTVLVGSVAGVKFSQARTLKKINADIAKMGPSAEVVSTMVAEVQTWEGTLATVGSVSAAKGVAISNDAPGVVSRIHFDSGRAVRTGQILVELDTQVERAQLASVKSRVELAKLTLERSKTLHRSGSIPQSQVDNDEAQLKAVSADAEALEAQIARKTVRAPFSGRLGIHQINLGQYLPAGSTIAMLEALNSVFADFTMPQQLLSAIRVGMVVRISLEGSKGGGDEKEFTSEGRITAVTPDVDPATRSIKVRASVSNKKQKLQPGMFAKVSVVLPGAEKSLTIPITAVVHASFGDSIFIVEDAKDEKSGSVIKGPDGKPLKAARQQFVRIGEARGDYVSVTKGLKSGQEVVSAGAFKLRNGSIIAVNNSFQVKPELSPNPDEPNLSPAH